MTSHSYARLQATVCVIRDIELWKHTTLGRPSTSSKRANMWVVFSDVQMPGMDGFELQRWLRQHRPRVKVLLASGVENVKAASGYMGPPRWLLFKPYDMASLEQRIRELIGG